MRIEPCGLDLRRPGPSPDGRDRQWAETNCYVDLWIELLGALGLEHEAAGSFAFESDFLGDQWTFFKHPAEDLRALYGIEVGELTVWRPLVEHVVEYLRRGQLLTVEVDAWHLPDTAGVSYRQEHVKTTVVPVAIDPDDAFLGYFHNRGYHELRGEDYAALLGQEDGAWLPPYVELVRVPARGARPAAEALAGAARRLAAAHLARRPAANPLERFAARLGEDLAMLRSNGMEAFHRYAFATCRQCGAAAEVAADFVAWLEATETELGLEGSGVAAKEAEQALAVVSAGAKALQLSLARGVAGRRVDTAGLLERMAAGWDAATVALRDCYG